MHEMIMVLAIFIGLVIALGLVVSHFTGRGPDIRHAPELPTYYEEGDPTK